MSTLPKPKVLSSWNALLKEHQENKDRWNGWLFRGQIMEERDHESPSVRTSLERSIERFGVSPKGARGLEYKLLRDFKRRCHLVSSYSPAMDNKMEWLALFRHFGGPSRLSDWTYSFWAAVYFALDRAKVVKPNKDICEVWALNTWDWQKRAEKRFSRLKYKLKRYGSNSREEGEALFKVKRPGLWTMNSFRLNNRLSIQQGTFLVPLDVARPFMDNLLAIAPKHMDANDLAIYRIVLNIENLKECLKELHRMNLTRATLYPGLDGLAQSLENAIAMPHLFHEVKGDLSTGPF
jgi:FRG domain